MSRSAKWSASPTTLTTGLPTTLPTTLPTPFAAPAPSAVYAVVYTADMAKTVPVREFRSNLSELLGDVADRRDHVLVTRNGKPAAALIPIDEYEALEETAEVLSDVDLVHAIDEGLGELDRGETISLAELRRGLAGRREPS